MLKLAKTERYIPTHSYHLLKFMVIFALGWFGAVTSLGQDSDQEFRKVLRDEAAFTANDFSALERGEMVVRLLPLGNRREVAICGVMRMPVPIAVSLQAFQESMTQRGRESVLEIGKFSNPPSLEDVQALTLEDRDIEDLKQCVVGQCELKMSAAMIERFRKEVDWPSPDYRTQATRLFRQMLLEYVRDYLAHGNSALIEYRDQTPGVRLDEEHRSLLESSLYINDFAPELTKYLQSFPKPELTGVDNAINWTKVNFGLKPVTIITHVATYKRKFNGVPQILVVQKQLYANHYFDSSLALTALINVARDGSTSDSYLLYTNRSRADSLAGSFSKLKRALVEEEAVANLNAILIQTLQNLENRSMTQAGSPRSGNQKLAELLFGGRRLIWWLITITALGALFVFRKRNQKRSV
jgi:hypothetical protein